MPYIWGGKITNDPPTAGQNLIGASIHNVIKLFILFAVVVLLTIASRPTVEKLTAFSVTFGKPHGPGESINEVPDWFSSLPIGGSRRFEWWRGEVVHIEVEGSPVDDAWLANVVGLKSLKTLSVTRCVITDAGLVHLEGLGSLKRLDLSDTQITDSGLTHLVGLTRLESLVLYNTQVSDSGAERLQRALPNCQIGYGFLKRWEP